MNSPMVEKWFGVVWIFWIILDIKLKTNCQHKNNQFGEVGFVFLYM